MNARTTGGRVALGVTAVLGLGSVAAAGASAAAVYAGVQEEKGHPAPEDGLERSGSPQRSAGSAASEDDGDGTLSEDEEDALSEDDEYDEDDEDDDEEDEDDDDEYDEDEDDDFDKDGSSGSSPVQDGSGTVPQGRSSGS